MEPGDPAGNVGPDGGQRLRRLPTCVDDVATFVPERTGSKFNPHVSTRLAPRDFLNQLKGWEGQAV